MPDRPYGLVVKGDEEAVRQAYACFERQPVDQEVSDPDDRPPARVTTLGGSVAVTGPGTFFGGVQRTLHFEPSTEPGWQFERTDLPDCFPIDVTVKNVWPVPIVRNAVSSIVLLSGSPHNYMRMVEHIISLRVGLGLDNVRIRMDSGDPPLFDRGSLDLVEAVQKAGLVGQSAAPTYVTVRKPVTIGGAGGSFLTILPAQGGSPDLTVDCAIDFKTAIGKQRVRFTVGPKIFTYASQARTNTPLWKVYFTKTVGKLFADTRNLGYTRENVSIAGAYRYLNPPRLLHNGKALEAAWHRSTLDLLAAVALIDKGRLAGTLLSYKSGHNLDVDLVRQIYKRDLLVRL